MQTRDIATLTREVRYLRALVVGLLVAVSAVAVSGFQRNQQAQVLRARGLVIIDEQGRERILIGAPIPAARNRVRTDTARVRALWGARFPARYMEWYRDYRHAMHGVLVLNELGYDVVAIGDSLPDPNIGRRVASHAGIIFNTGEGHERGGMGAQRAADGGYAAGLGLDSPTQSDAVGLWVSEKRGAYLVVANGTARVELGTLRAQRSAAPRSSSAPDIGVAVSNGDTVRYRVSAIRP